MLSRKGNFSGTTISIASADRIATWYQGAAVPSRPQIQLRLQPPPQLCGVEEDARIDRRGEQGRAQAVFVEQRKELFEQFVEGDRRGLGALPVVPGAIAGQVGMGPEGEGV